MMLASAFAVALAYHLIFDLLYVHGIDPIEVEIEGENAHVVENSLITSYLFINPSRTYVHPVRENSKMHVDVGRIGEHVIGYRISGIIDSLNLYLPKGWKTSLRRLGITIAGQTREYSAGEIDEFPRQEKRWHYADRETVEDVVRIDRSVLKNAPGLLFGHVVNPVRERVFWTVALSSAALVSLLAVLVVCLSRIGFFAVLATAPGLAGDAPGETPRRVGWVCLTGAIVVALALVVVYLLQPHPFTRDDNYAQFLPVIQIGCEALGNGVWPDFNVYQFRGSPIFSLGTYAISYPGMILSCAASSLAFGGLDFTIEIFAVFHLIAGYFAAFAWARYQGVDSRVCAGLAISLTLSGFFFMAGRSWYYMLPVALWLPILLLLAEMFIRGRPGWKWAIATGLAIALFFHSGNAQIWFYCVATWAVLLLFAFPNRPIRLVDLLMLAGAGLIALGGILPLLTSQAAQIDGLDRTGGLGIGIFPRVWALFVPGALFDGPDLLLGQNERHVETYFSGGVFTFLGCLGLLFLVGRLARAKLDRPYVLANRYIIVGGVLLLLAGGDSGILWELMARLPAFEYFNYPFKFLPLLSFCLGIGGVGVLGAMTSMASERWGRSIVGLCASLSVVLTLANLFLTTRSFFDFEAGLYPELPKKISAIVAAGPDSGGRLPPRVVVFAPWRAKGERYVTSLPLDLSSRFKIPNLGGYDPLIEDRLDDRELLDNVWSWGAGKARELGVRWLIVYRPNVLDFRGRLEQNFLTYPITPERMIGEASIAAALGRTTIYDLGEARPYAFFPEDEARPATVALSEGLVLASFEAASAPRPLILNFQYRKGTRVESSRGDLEATPDALGRIAVMVPEGVDGVRLGHWGGGWRGLWGAVLALILGVCCVFLAARVGKRRGNRPREAPAPG